MTKRPESFSDILKLESCRWPRTGDRLMRSAADSNRGVKFTKDEISRHVFIWSGCMNAAAALIEVSEGDRPEREILIYPILYNYRHGVELAMKWIIVRYGRYSSSEAGRIEHHDLWNLWQICRRIITEVGTDGEAILIVEQVIKELHDLDRRALAFRYSHNKKGALIALPDALIDLENVRDVMEAVGKFFGGADAQLAAYISAWP
jgi:hypothetical protein